jgi:hypothetical protein
MIHRKMEIINFIGMPISIISSGPRKDEGDDEDIMLIILSHMMVKKNCTNDDNKGANER